MDLVSLETQEESDQTALMVLEAEFVICCAEFNQLEADPQPDPQSLLEKVKQLTKEVETLKQKAGKLSGELDGLASSLQDLTWDLAVLRGPVITCPYLLEKLFSYLNSASVKTASRVSR